MAREVALKALEMVGNEQIEELSKEAQNMMKLNYPNVVKFWGIYKGFFLKIKIKRTEK